MPVVLAAASVGTVLAFAFSTGPPLFWGLLMASGTALAGYSIAHISGTGSEVFYLGPVMYFAYFTGRRTGLLHCGWLAIVQAAVVLYSMPTAPLVRWQDPVMSFLALTLVVNYLSRRVETAVEGLEEMARTDSLTGLLNHGAFTAALEGEVERSRRACRPVALVMVDADLFKSINDRYGHEGGDKALRMLARVLSEETRGGDAVGRLGGEEFAVVLHETGIDGAAVFATRIRKRLRLAQDELGHELTVSQGLAAVDLNMTAPDLLRAADSALYRAKSRGRDRYEIHRDDQDGDVPALAATS
jgi:diguanylate cyclase (GGDEF)-like protein